LIVGTGESSNVDNAAAEIMVDALVRSDLTSNDEMMDGGWDVSNNQEGPNLAHRYRWEAPQ
jgi:hypothetical protein